MNSNVLAIDIGGTKTVVAVVDKDFNIKNKSEFFTPTDQAEFIKVLKGDIEKLDQDKSLPVGVAICGLLSIDGKKLLVAPNLNWRDMVLKDFFSSLDRKLHIVNDGTAAAWGSYITERSENVKRFLTLTLGTGVGGGIILDDHLVLGAGEIGHIKIREDGPLCGCGKKGCLEAFVGGRNIPARVNQWYGLNIETSKELYQLAADGDSSAKESWERIGAILGYALSGVVNLNGIQMITIGGKVTRAKGYFLEALKRALTLNLMDAELQGCSVSISKWGDGLSLIGAAAVVIEPPNDFK
ncbi:ROK family protein [Elusimicrobiota bacterium]